MAEHAGERRSGLGLGLGTSIASAKGKGWFTGAHRDLERAGRDAEGVAVEVELTRPVGGCGAVEYVLFRCPGPTG